MELISIDYPHWGSTRPAIPYGVRLLYAHDMPSMCTHMYPPTLIPFLYVSVTVKIPHSFTFIPCFVVAHRKGFTIPMTTDYYRAVPLRSEPKLMLVVAYSITTIGWMMFTIPSGGWFMTLFYTRKKKTQGGAPWLAKLVYNSHFTMVYGRYNELVNGDYKPTFTSLGGTILQGSASGDYVDYLKSHDLPLLAPKFATSSALPYDARER